MDQIWGGVYKITITLALSLPLTIHSLLYTTTMYTFRYTASCVVYHKNIKGSIEIKAKAIIVNTPPPNL